MDTTHLHTDTAIDGQSDNGPFIATASGGRFYFLRPDAKDVHLEDVAHALSHCNRFTGHTIFPYSVAQHSVYVAMRVAEQGYPLEIQRQALLHDATEAYLGDVAKPLKSLLPSYMRLEAEVWSVICQRFQIPFELHPAVKEADRRMLATEAEQLMCGHTWSAAKYEPYKSLYICGWQPKTAAGTFLAMANAVGVDR